MRGGTPLTRRIDQVVSVLEPTDAVGNEIRAVRDALQARGCASSIYTVRPRAGDGTRPLRDLLRAGSDCVLYHYPVASTATAQLAASRLRLVLVYHNVTPAHHFVDIDRAHYDACVSARCELRTLVGRVDLALGKSEYSRRELDSMGFDPTGAFPVVLPEQRLVTCGERNVDAEGGRRARLLTVGRVAPNKRIEDALRILAAYRVGVDRDATLHVVGDCSRLPVYRAALDGLAEDLGVTNAVEFTGRVDDDTLARQYSSATVFLSTSVHEGFGVPLVEAMLHELPVMARAAAAVPETLGDAGVRYRQFDAPLCAELLALLHEDAALRARQLALGRRRASELTPDAALSTLWRHLRGIGVAIE